MRLRQKQALLRLQKISETSSPSPNRQKKTEETNSNRINPLAIHKSSVYKLPQSPSPDLSQKLKTLHQKIMENKARNTLWEDAHTQRELPVKEYREVLKNIVRNLVFIGRGQQNFGMTVLKALKKGKKGLVQWTLCWLRQLFWLIGLVLTNSHLAKH